MQAIRNMKTRSNDPVRFITPSRDILRDPALWAWLLVVLLAILPVRVALAGG